MTRRLIAAIYWDAQLQFRNGFYYAAAFVTVVWILLLTRLPDLDLSSVLPAIILTNLQISTFYFMAGLVLLEKVEGTLLAQAVTPQRLWEYLASKVLTLLILVLIENLIVIGLIFGFRFSWVPVLMGISLGSMLLILAGFISVSRYESINAYLMPSVIYTMLLSLPAMPYFGVGRSEWFFWHPFQAPLLLLQTGFGNVPNSMLVLSLVFCTAWIWAAFYMSKRVYYTYIIGHGV